MLGNEDGKINYNRINLLRNSPSGKSRAKRIFRLSKFLVYLLAVLMIAFFVFSYQVIFTGNSISKIFSGGGILKQLSSLAGHDTNLKGTNEDRVNFLLLGIGGAGHDGPLLTDTVILMSVKPSTNQMTMISLPRDLYVDIPGFGWWKLNNAYAFGEQKGEGLGGLLAKEVLEKTLNMPIHYYVRVDFSGFATLIDELGGLKINVEKEFTDYQFPTDNYQFKVVSFESGPQTFDEIGRAHV